jgi:cell wall-associated NlpC family hydrolase
MTRFTRAGTALLAVIVSGTLLSVGTPGATAGSSDPYLSSRVPVANGCIVLNRAWAGNKVALVQRRLDTTYELDRYGTGTYDAVRAFQQRKGLKVTGRVNHNTWRALKIGRAFCMDRFTVQPSVTKPTTSDKRIHAMIAWAREQLGRPYIWGGAGPIGYDCSGLALQAMHAGGRVLPTVTTYLHQRRDFPTASRIFDSGLPRRPLKERQRGDLVFFGPAGSISHMGIYLGNGRILEAVRPKVRIASMWGRSTPVKQRVIRPFGR